MPDTVDVTLPSMGESVTEGIVARWVKAPGDAVKQGETLVEVTTDKVDVEVPAPASGKLGEIVAHEGATVEVGATLATIEPGASVGGNGAARQATETPAPPSLQSAAGGPRAEQISTAPAAPESRGGQTAGEEQTDGAGGGDGGTPPAAPAPPQGGMAGEAVEPAAMAHERVSPLARRAAALHGVDLGQGGGGVIRRGDVDGHNGVVPRTAAPQVQPGEDAETLRGPAGALVDYMERSRDIPTATSFRTISVATLDARRRELNIALSAAGRALKVSYTHLIGYAIARAAADMPDMAAHFARSNDGAPARVRSGVHLGLAVDSKRKDGTRFLIVPVIRDAAERSFADFREEYERLIDRARTNALTADELQGASITLTNPGGIGTMMSVPRLMPGQGTIIAAGAVGYPPEWSGVPEAQLHELGVGKVMTLTSTYDHRIIQGAQSGEFLGRIAALLSGESSFFEDVFTSLGLAGPSRQAQLVSAPTEAASVPQGEGVDRALLGAMQAATSLVKAHRTHGHLGAHLDPLGKQPVGDPAMEPDTYGLTPDLMARIPAELLRVYVPGRTLAEVLPELRRTYCGTIAYEIEHISSHEQRVWLREHIESGAYRLPLSPEDRTRLFGRLTKVDAMERYLRRTFIGQKTFSIEGVDAMVPMLEALLGLIAQDGIDEVVLGMAHRGRLAVIAHVVNRPYESILNAFELGEVRRSVGEKDDATGDVKYHIGAVGTYVTEHGAAINVRLLANPSHLEAVDPVVEGWARAEQTQRHSNAVHLDPAAAMPVLIHGDAAFAGQGIVAEVLNMQSLEGYTTGGTVHIIVDNQLGFTTDSKEGRSTRYASDLAKGFDVPIVHVNADDIEACIAAVRFAYDYRRTYHRDVVIDLVGYRRFGHNEADEPAYTQPLMYQKIRTHPTVREIFAARLVEEGAISQAEVDAMSEQVLSRLQEAHARVKENLAAELDEHPHEPPGGDVDDVGTRTRVGAHLLRSLNAELLGLPDGFTLNSKLQRQMDRRRASVEEGGIDWGTAEALAFASLLVEGCPIRLSGQDTARGTFSQRHLAFHDERTGEVHIPMQHLADATATFEVHNSPLSEVACLGFEYGYSAADAQTLVLWEAQYGDFVNNAQMVVDQFVSAGHAKWGVESRLTLLLPHGYEGNGPEHSSARIERFLSLSADGNMRVANVSTAAQYFHLLRNQGLTAKPRPLVLATPKSLLRLRESASELTELSEGEFLTVIDDADAAQRRDAVRALVLCTGRLYYDLRMHERRAAAEQVAIARVELLHPFPVGRIEQLIARYPRLERLIWVQEEPSNMGGWPHVALHLRNLGSGPRVEYIGRSRRASPSEGYAGSHRMEQERIVTEALAAGTPS